MVEPRIRPLNVMEAPFQPSGHAAIGRPMRRCTHAHVGVAALKERCYANRRSRGSIRGMFTEGPRSINPRRAALIPSATVILALVILYATSTTVDHFAM